jgi:aconitate hydratase
LKKQGLLALTFRDPAAYDAVRAGDRLSLTGLDSLAPGRPVSCTLYHQDGTSEELALVHSYSEAQLDWFRAGSALNTFQRPSRNRDER